MKFTVWAALLFSLPAFPGPQSKNVAPASSQAQPSVDEICNFISGTLEALNINENSAYVTNSILKTIVFSTTRRKISLTFDVYAVSVGASLHDVSKEMKLRQDMLEISVLDVDFSFDEDKRIWIRALPGFNTAIMKSRGETTTYPSTHYIFIGNKEKAPKILKALQQLQNHLRSMDSKF